MSGTSVLHPAPRARNSGNQRDRFTNDWIKAFYAGDACGWYTKSTKNIIDMLADEMFSIDYLESKKKQSERRKASRRFSTP
jgi:hypothetical protein